MGKGFLIPITLSIFFGLIVSYLITTLQRKTTKKWGIILGISSYVLVIMVVLGGLFATTNYIEEHKEQFSGIITQSRKKYQSWKQQLPLTSSTNKENSENTDISPPLSTITSIAGGTIKGITTTALVIILSIFIALYAGRIQKFLDAIGEKEIWNIAEKTVAQYSIGLTMVVGILAVLYTIGLLLLGVDHAIIIGLLSALATYVPTIGTFLGGLGASIAGGLITNSIQIALLIAGRYILIQTVEEYVILPKLVGGKVSLNILASLILVFARGVLRGVAGVFLGIPIMGVIQKILKKKESPYAILLGKGN